MTTLRDNFLGCIAASWVGSAMGAAVEGWTRERIKETHGYLDRLVPYKHYTGHTQNLKQRLKHHNEGQTKTTKSYRPSIVITYTAVNTKEKALALEKYLKTGSGRAFLKKRCL